VQDDLGRDVALAIARLLVLFLKRPGGQSQFSAHLAAQLDGDSPIAMLQRWILNHLDTDLTIEALAERVHKSPRNFARHFLREAGAPPGVFVERARLDAARRALEDGSIGWKPSPGIAASPAPRSFADFFNGAWA
jgi:transcriptional regulator GlxA family with amidase domain